MDAKYLDQVAPLLPEQLLASLSNLRTFPNAEAFLEDFLRFVVGAAPSSATTATLQKQWQEKQAVARGTILSLLPPSQSHTNGQKRTLDEGTSGADPKRQKTSPPSNAPPTADDTPVFTLHSVSATSPVRRKVDITIGKSTITFKHATSGNLESVIPLSSIRRAFLLPTRGKSKPHWTVVLLSSDTADKDKPSGSATQDSPQIIFGLDATTTAPLNTSTYPNGGSEPTKSTLAKGSPSLPAIREFLSHLPGVVLHEPTSAVFKSAVTGIGSNASTTGIPGVEAYRAAKQGNLWFMKEGILWGENKPCEFWSVEDLINGVEGVRISPGSGRVFSITLARKLETEESDENNGEDEDQGPQAIETELGMIDSRERDVIADWVRKQQHLFGRKAGDAPLTSEEIKKQKEKQPKYTGPVTIHQLAAESDSEDEDFTVSSDDDDGGSAASDSDSEDGGSNADSNDEQDAEGTDDDGEGEEEEEVLDPAHHPLLRPGAMPKMSKAAMNMVVDMMEDEVMGAASDGPEGDELDDD
ncbi:histone chaperone Rttp106-like-domain-containing protein [Coprinopsis sp. MPI-PUGE-AT-0042]|nr:histone chaperone Rttp106-like-domain-containing protein [Coprinopsis sp. MPI-PUGE-AT-0042]